MLILNVIDNGVACECGVSRVLIMTYHQFTRINFLKNGLKRERASCFDFIVLRLSCYCKCSVTLPHGAVGWTAVYDCVTS